MSKEYVVTMNVTLNGATCIVKAESQEEAISKANAGEHDGLDTSCAEMVNWEATEAEEN